MDAIQLLTGLVVLAVGSGGGGIVGGLIMVKRLNMEQKESETNQTVNLRNVDVEHFKAMFPGGLGDAVEHWRDEATAMYEILEQRQRVEEELRAENETLRVEIRKLQRDLKCATDRINVLEAEMGGYQ